MNQSVVVAVIVAIASFYLGRMLIGQLRAMTSKKSGGCSNCGCGKDAGEERSDKA